LDRGKAGFRQAGGYRLVAFVAWVRCKRVRLVTAQLLENFRNMGPGPSRTSHTRRSANFGSTESSKVRIQHPAQPRSYTRGSCVHDGEASQDSVRKTTDRCGATERSRATEFIRTSSRRSILAQAGGNSSPKLCSEQDGGPSCMTNRQLKDRL
jgi:hypothetical protein